MRVTSTLDAELMASRLISTNICSKEMTLLSQTLTLVYKAVSFTTVLVPLHLRYLLPSPTGLLFQASSSD